MGLDDVVADAHDVTHRMAEAAPLDAIWHAMLRCRVLVQPIGGGLMAAPERAVTCLWCAACPVKPHRESRIPC